MVLTELRTPFGAPVYYKESTSSTMEDAFFLWTQGALPGTAVIAGVQTSGRGRFSHRPWIAPLGSCLMFTQILPQEDPRWSGGTLGFLWALALVRVLEAEGLAGTIKWPNDVMVNSKKLCGILIQGKRGAYLCGLGINLNQRSFGFSSQKEPTSLALEGVQMSWETLFIRLQEAFFQEMESPEPLVDRVTPRLFGLNQPVQLISGLDGPRIHGILRGLGAGGEALVETPQGVQHVLSGELDS